MVVQDDEYLTTSVSIRTIGEMINASHYPSNTSKLEEYDTNRHIVKILILSTFPFILLIGTVGNSLTFIIMQRGSLKHSSTCFYMAILALADSSKLNSLFCDIHCCRHVIRYNLCSLSKIKTRSISLEIYTNTQRWQ